ncbi:MAG TPA: mechanosensitive ion channel domain-containing protein [Candidatus Nitrosotenuis sp.]|nr:mechanosensitive ion channel domain-containing protein [Candidatus Nitrosotenuis sp.]
MPSPLTPGFVSSLLSDSPGWLVFSLRVGGILLLAAAAVLALRALTQRLVKLAETESRLAVMREQQTRTLAGILRSAGTAIILTVALLMLLDVFGLNVTPIAAAAGLASVALGFGAQHLVRDVINGFFIVFEDQFVVGDTVRIGGVSGRVEHLTLRRTVLRDAEGALITLANGEIRQVANLSRDWSQVFVDVAISSEENLHRALQALERAAAELREDANWSAALLDGPRVLGVESLGPRGTTLRLQVRTLPTRQHEVARELRARIKARFEQERIGIPQFGEYAEAPSGGTSS